MGIITTRYVKKPLFVEAVQVTRSNFSSVVKWCDGKVKTERPDHNDKPNQKYIKLQTHNPINTRQTKAYIGDWILKTDRGVKVYTQKAFTESFDLAQPKDRSVEAQVQDFDDREDELDSCASPRAQIDPGVPQ